MINLPKPIFLNPTKAFRRLSIMLAIHHQSAPSQHKIAKETNLSSSMVNNYIKEMVSNGLISTSNRNNRDYNYTITKNGKQELMNFLLGYSAEIVQLFALSKKEITRRLAPIFNQNSPVKIVLFGASETCELVMQALKNFPQAKVIGIVDSAASKHHCLFHNYVVMPPQNIPSLAPDYVIITSFAKQNEISKDSKKYNKNGIKIITLSSI